MNCFKMLPELPFMKVMTVPSTNAGPEAASTLADIVAQVIAIGATRFEVCRNYDQENVWAVKGPVEFSVVSFPSDSANARSLRNELEKGQITVVVNGIDYFLVLDTCDSARERQLR